MSSADQATARPDAPAADRRVRGARPSLPRRLSTKLLWVTMTAVMLAEVLIFVPSVANFRRQWLAAKVETVAVASLAAERGANPNKPTLDPDQEAELLKALDAELIAVSSGGVSRLLGRTETVGDVDITIKLAKESVAASIVNAFEVLFFGGDRQLRLLGPVGDGSVKGEVVMRETPLRRAMLAYARNIFALSLIIALFAGTLVYLAINLFLLRPIRRMTGSMIRFGENPADPDRIIRPTGRNDEIGSAEVELAAMQSALSRTLREQRHLADLGLAVSKINHDLRNILASAQLVSDRLADVPDPRVQRFAPTLFRSLDRALSYTNSVLAYGRAVESRPVKRQVLLHRLVDEILEPLREAPGAPIDLINAVPPDFAVAVDPDQFFRAVGNLVRNAADALRGEAGEMLDAVVRRVTVSAEMLAAGGTRVAVEDTGPGLSERARENLFQAFRGSTRSGGTGLGLAIAAEIVEAHGGRIRLADTRTPGARFEIDLPPADPPSSDPPPSDPPEPTEQRAAGEATRP